MSPVVTRDQLSHDPAVAAQQREQAERARKAKFHADRQAAIEAERARNAERARVRREQREAAEKAKRRERGRAYGRKRDQIETCYRQHTPAQIKLADEMRCSG